MHICENDLLSINSLGTYYNATQGVVKQKDTGEWIQECYPDVWTDLEKIPASVDPDDGKIRFNIDRRVPP